MSFSTLNIGASALFATQRAIEAAGQNVANASVDGYSRQVVRVTAALPTPGTSVGGRSDGMHGNGVVVTSVDRLRDQLADVAYRSEAAADGYAGARSSTLDRAQNILGSVSDGVPATLDKFWASFDALSNNPTDTAARNTVLNAGSEISRSLRDASSQLAALTSDAASQVSSDVTSVNGLAAQVADLNKSILDARSSGQSPNDLLDARDRAIDQLHTLAGVNTHENSLGVVDVYIGTHALVRADSTVALQAGAAAGGAPTVTWADDGTSVGAGGSIGGYLSETNVDLPGLRSMLDSVAQGLMSTVNGVHAAGYGLPAGGSGSGSTGSTAPTGTAFFAGTDASNIDLAPGLTASTLAASATGAANDGNQAIALAALRGKTNAVTLPDGTTASVGDALRAIGGRLGALASGAAATHTATNSALASANKSRESANGVSVDEEMVDLVKWQHAYSAAAKVISTADSMLDTLINRLGA